ncbi:MAG: hypothetical protein ACO307_18845, partial [Ilumatobacteraceae bacterium]
IDAYGHGVSSDADGNIAFIGDFWTPIDADPGSGTAIYTPLTPSPSNLSSDMYVGKYDADGELLWFHQYPYLGGRKVAFDPSGNLWALAYVADGDGATIDLDPGPGTAEITGNTYNASRTALISYDPDGNFRMATIWEASATVQAEDIVFDTEGNPIVTSLIPGTNGRPATITYSRRLVGAADPADSTFAKPTGAGTGPVLSTWIRFDKDDATISAIDDFEVSAVSPIGASGAQLGSILVAPGGELLVSGNFYGSIDFDIDPTGTAVETAVGGGSGFVVQYAADGSFDWVDTVIAADPNVNGSVTMLGLGLDGDDNVYASGSHQFDVVAGSTTLAVDDGHGHLISWATDGSVRWAIPVAGEGVIVGAAGTTGALAQPLPTAEHD